MMEGREDVLTNPVSCLSVACEEVSMFPVLWRRACCSCICIGLPI